MILTETQNETLDRMYIEIQDARKSGNYMRAAYLECAFELWRLALAQE